MTYTRSELDDEVYILVLFEVIEKTDDVGVVKGVHDLDLYLDLRYHPLLPQLTL